MTAKQKQKQKKMPQKKMEDPSRSSPRSDEDEDDDDDDDGSEKIIGCEMWQLTRMYKAREATLERWLNGKGFSSSSMGKKGGESMWMYHAVREITLSRGLKAGKSSSSSSRIAPEHVGMALEKAIEHRRKASMLTYKYAKRTGETLDKAFFQHNYYIKVLMSVKLLFMGEADEAAKLISSAMHRMGTEEDEEEEEEEEDVSVPANSARKDDVAKERRQEQEQEQQQEQRGEEEEEEKGNTRFGDKSGAPYALPAKSGQLLLDQMRNDANDLPVKLTLQSSKNKKVKSLEEVEKQSSMRETGREEGKGDEEVASNRMGMSYSKAANVALTPTSAEIFQNMFKQQPGGAKGGEEREILPLRGSQRKKNESDSGKHGMSLQELERQLEMKFMNTGTALKKDEEDPEDEAMFLGSNRMDKKSRTKEEENETMRMLSSQMAEMVSSAKEKKMDWREVPMQASLPLAPEIKVEKHWPEVPMQASVRSRSRFRFAALEIEEEDEPIESRRAFDENTSGFNLGLSNDILNAAPAFGPGSVGFSSLNSDEDVIKEEGILDEDNINDDKNEEVKKPRPEVLAAIAKQERMQKQKLEDVDCGLLTLDSSSSEEEEEEEEEENERQEQQPQQQQRAQKQPHAADAKNKKTISFASEADAAALQAENEEAEKKRWKQKQIEAEIARKKKEEVKLIQDQRTRMNALEDLNECAKTLLMKLEHAYKEVQTAWQNFHSSFREGNGIAALLEATSVTNACIEYVDLTMRKSLKKKPELNSIERIITAAHLAEAIRLIAEKNEHSKMSWQRALEIVSDLTFGGNYSSVIPKRERAVFAFDLLRGVNKRKESNSTLPGLKKFYESNKVKLESTGLDVPTRHAMQMMGDFIKDSKREDWLPLIEILTEHVDQQLSRMVEDVDNFCFSKNGLVIVSRMVHELFAPEKDTERLADRVLSEPVIQDVAEKLATSGKTWQCCIESHKDISIECAFDSFLDAFKAVFQLWATTDESRYKTFCEDLRMKKALGKNDAESAAKIVKEFYGMGERGLFPLKRLVSQSLQNNTPSVQLVFALHSMAMSRVHTDCNDCTRWRTRYFMIANQVLSWEEKELIQLKDFDEHNDVFLPRSQIILSEEIKTFEMDGQVQKDKVCRDRLSRDCPLFAGSGVLFIETMTGIVESMDWLELHRSMTFALHLYNCLRQTVPSEMPQIEILERLMGAFGKNKTIFISGKAPKKKFLTEWMLAVWGSLAGPMGDESKEEKSEEEERRDGERWLESSSVCKTIVRQKYPGDDLSTKVNATREALTNDPLFGINLSKVAVDLIALPRKMIVSLGDRLEDALSLYWSTDAEECKRIGQRMSMQYVLAKAILPNVSSNGVAVEDEETERRSCDTIRNLYSPGDEYRKRAAKEIANMFFHDDDVRKGIYYFREFDDFEDTNLHPPRRSNARGLFKEYQNEFSRHENMPRLKMEKEREELERIEADLGVTSPEKKRTKKKKSDSNKKSSNQGTMGEIEQMMKEMLTMVPQNIKHYPRLIEMAQRLDPETFQREGRALLNCSPEYFEMVLTLLHNLDAETLRHHCPEALNLRREDLVIQLQALSMRGTRGLQPPEMDEEEAIRRATAASLGDFTQPSSHERRREDSHKVEQRSPIYDKVNFRFLAILPDLLLEPVTVPIDMYKCETIYDLMVKISQWTNRRLKVSEMILELDGKKLRKFETIDEAGIRENSELVLRTETKKHDDDVGVFDEEEEEDDDEDEDDDILGGESDFSAGRSDASYESEYEFEYEDPSSASEGSDDDD
jgi:hypothetical protein